MFTVAAFRGQLRAGDIFVGRFRRDAKEELSFCFGRP